MTAAAPRLDRLFALMTAHADRMALCSGTVGYSYDDLLRATDAAEGRITENGIATGDVIGVQSDFTLPAIALVLALFRKGCIAALVSPSANAPAILAEARAAGFFSAGKDGDLAFRALAGESGHPLLDQLRAARKPGFIIFSSGSSGKPKAILHDLDGFLASYERPTKPLTTLAFLLFDHIAGIDTLLYTLHAGGALALIGDRGPRTVCDAIEQWQVEVLPVSPSFLKLLCISGAADQSDLRSLRIITFGSEPMDKATLERVTALFPNVLIRQKYGASEFGAPSAKTRDGDGLWIKLSGNARARIENGVLWLKAPTTMLGYLNADQPLMQDGWICTGDRVEIDGEWMRILGRDTDLINVGGEKVFPSEVEAVISELDAVADVAVAGESHPLLGQIVSAVVRPRDEDQDHAALRSQVRSHCMRRLNRYKVPAKISITSAALFNERQKVSRAIVAASTKEPDSAGQAVAS